jgi:hypothetical protein
MQVLWLQTEEDFSIESASGSVDGGAGPKAASFTIPRVRAPPSRDCRRSDQFARALIGGFWDRLSRYPSAPTPTIEFGQASASSRDEALSGVDLTKAIGPTIGASSRFVKFEMGSILKLNSALREIDQQAYKIC